MKAQGYTLSEILISLAILGICMAVSIPMIAQQREKSARKAVFKETIGTVQEIIRAGMVQDELTPLNFSGYITSRVNAIKVCPSNSQPPPSGQGCWDPAIQMVFPPDPLELNEAGFIMPSGARVVGFSNCCAWTSTDWSNGVVFDWNGLKGPNTVGDDQLVIEYCFGSQTCTVSLGAPIPPGGIRPWDAGNNAQLFNEIYK